MFRSIESFQAQLNKTIAGLNKANDKVIKAEVELLIAQATVADKADDIRAEADALIVRANQINKMVDEIVERTEGL